MQSLVRLFDQYWMYMVLGVLGAAYLYWKWKSRETIRKFAREMGLVYSTGTDELLGLFNKGQSAPGPPGNPSAIKDFLGLLSNWRLDGKINGVPISVYRIAERISGTDDRTQKFTLLKAH